MSYDFDRLIERRSTHSTKWNWFEPDVLPLWVADMDFQSPPEVAEALRARAEHGVFGYQFDSPPLREVIAERFANRYRASITTEQIAFIPGLVVALNMICRVFAPGAGVMVQPPIYPPFLSTPGAGGGHAVTAPLAAVRDGASLRYEIDFDAMERAVTPDTKVFLLCNPHNPVGRVFTRAELEGIAEFALRHDLLLVSDEIHCDLIYPGYEHHTFCTIAPELNDRVIILQAPSKTFNVAGLGCGFAVVPNAKLHARLIAGLYSNGLFVNVMGFTAAEAAYRYGEPWRAALMDYLADNRDLVEGFVAEHFPQASVTRAEGTFLSWIDFSAYQLSGGAFKHFLDHAKVGLNDGSSFGGNDYAGYVRLNFGAPRVIVLEALERMRAALR